MRETRGERFRVFTVRAIHIPISKSSLCSCAVKKLLTLFIHLIGVAVCVCVVKNKYHAALP